MRILWLAPEAPVPPLSGGCERARRMLRHLAARHDVALVTYAGEADQAGLDDLAADVKRIVRLAYGSRWPGWAIRRAVRQFQPDAIHVGGPSMMQYIPRGFGGRVVYDCHDAPLAGEALPGRQPEARQFFKYKLLSHRHKNPLQISLRSIFPPPCKGEVDDPQGRTEGVLANQDITFGAETSHCDSVEQGERPSTARSEGIFAKKPANSPYSAKIWDRVDAVIAVSDADAARLADHFPKRWVHVLPNGVDLAYWRAVGGPPEPHTLLFPAALNWAPNRRAALDLVTRVLPALQKHVPSARLIIAGRMPDADLAARVAAHPAASLIADPPDMRPLFARAAAVVVPVQRVSGTRLKILQALAAGRPVVSTPDGAAGLGLTPDVHLLVAELDELAGAVARLLADPDLGARLRRAGREAADHYSWARHLPALDEVYP